jgi:hypothetical protein
MTVSSHRHAGAAKRNLVCALTSLAVATASCTSMHQVPQVPASPGQPAVWQVQAGDTVRVTMRNGSSAQFKVQSVAADVIVSTDGTRFDSTEIQSVERREGSGGKTALAVLAVVAAIGVVLLGITLIAVAQCSPNCSAEA